ncbi:MAG: YdiU family protein [Myxococcales bacterium]|nr:YdiU family protein [Myxococcales bacterium]
MYARLEDLTFANSFVDTLPGDPVRENQRRQVLEAAYSRVEPTPVAAPRLLALSSEAARLIDLDAETLDPVAFAEVMGGNRVTEAMRPYAACYGGHQFGSWAGQLGDGRAITLGEAVNGRGERWELQLKGAGPTPYSRRADGRAVLRSSVREFLCSEAMHHLGVPTTRALCLVGTGEKVVRDMFYDGHPQYEPGAVVCRMAPSFLRFGNFELPASRGDLDLLRALTEYAVERHFPHLGPVTPDSVCAWLAEVGRRTAEMVVHWMRVGFVHGVMNTDNMSVLGLTIDYGPYGWLEGYDPNWTPNTTDAQGRRYCFGAQPQVALWNLARFAEALAPLVGSVEPVQEALGAYADTFEPAQRAMFAAKLGLADWQDGDGELVEALLRSLLQVETDMTIFYRGLADVPIAADADDDARLAPIADAWYVEPSPAARGAQAAWLRVWAERVRADGRPDALRRAEMNRTNPKYVLRNYLAQLAIDAAEAGDPSRIGETLDVMRRPYDEQPGRDEYAAKRPEWARHRPGCSMLSCSS